MLGKKFYLHLELAPDLKSEITHGQIKIKLCMWGSLQETVLTFNF